MAVIENDAFQIHIDEHEGCSIRACFVKQGDALLPLMPDSRAESCELSESSFIMAPYSNRIENGAFSFKGTAHQLARADEHSIHGDVRQRPWTVLESTPSLLRCALKSVDCEQVNWPWDFEMEAVFELVGNCFQSGLRLINASKQDMPAGFGWHPYFSRALTAKDKEIRMQVETDSVYPDTDGNCLPSGPPRKLKASEDFSIAGVIGKDLGLDHCFYGYKGSGLLYWPGTGLRVNFDCSDECGHAVIYTPVGKPFIAFEPVTNANNGVNLLENGDDTAGTVVLAPGKSLSAQFDMTIEWD